MISDVSYRIYPTAVIHPRIAIATLKTGILGRNADIKLPIIIIHKQLYSPAPRKLKSALVYITYAVNPTKVDSVIPHAIRTSAEL
tara:strand:- start:486 stop:740 length:255 start_codon:yes stop_codon:yes gene_type:complete